MSKSNAIMETMPQAYPHIVAVRDLNDTTDNRFELLPDADDCTHIAAMLGLISVRKVRFQGHLRAVGKTDWRLIGKLGATAIQSCVITGDPITTRIDTNVERLFVKDFSLVSAESESEFNGDDDSEPLLPEIDLGQILTESLALALPDYPRSKDAKLGEAVFSAPGTTPLRDKDVKPFASLAALRDKMGK